MLFGEDEKVKKRKQTGESGEGWGAGGGGDKEGERNSVRFVISDYAKFT